MRFLRSKKLRHQLWMDSSGKCASCGVDLNGVWHADHIIPWEEKQDTNVHDMQALCQTCNLKKGAKSVKDRSHQAQCRSIASEFHVDSFPTKILAWVVPGGGKSRLPGILATYLPQHKIAWFVPRLSLRIQAELGMNKDFGISIRESTNETNPSRGTRGFVATHDALMENPKLWQHELKRSRYILVIDECHHAKIKRDGTMTPLARAISQLEADVSLFMTGTLETNDSSTIYGMAYDEVNGKLVVNPNTSMDYLIRYTRETALRERAIVPIEFMRHDGPVKWQNSDGEPREERISEVSREDESAAIFTALRTDVAIQLFESGVSHWQKNSAGKLIVVADRQDRAKEYAKRLRAKGISTALAIDDNEDAHREIREFRDANSMLALSTCMMAYEGLDVPEASHVICLTHIRSVPWIEQMLARVWRHGKKQCWAFVADDPRMNRVIKKIQEEQPASILLRDDGICGGDRPKPQDILAIDGSVDSVLRQFLDSKFATDEDKAKVLKFVEEWGFTGNEPQVVAFIELIASRKQHQIPAKSMIGTRERELMLRSQIADMARKIDGENARRRGADRPIFGETQKALIRKTGKPIGEMSQQELENAWKVLQTMLP